MLKIRLTKAQKAANVPPDAGTALESAWETLLAGARLKKNGCGWMNLPEQDLSALNEMGRELARFGQIVLIGIGGSALGTQMLMNAFCEPLYPFSAESGQPQLFVADNADARSNKAIWAQLEPRRAALLVVSKSGRTLETLSNFLFFREKLSAALGADVEKHIFAVTDPDKGFLHAYAAEKKTRCLDFPADTGGRYSVLSACGLAAAAALGIDAERLLAGAAAMKKALLEDTAGCAATAIAREVLRGEAAGRSVTVFWSYGDRLKSAGEWFAQLWGESLGKNGLGLTPQPALGSIDQHSQLQLYTSGPNDKFFFFLSEKPGTEGRLAIPDGKLFDEARYLDGISQESILDCERRGVVASLKRRGLPLCEIELERTDEFCLGGLIFLLETVTALVGLALGVDPFDQPGVEEGKNYALALCGSADYAGCLKTLEDIEAGSKSAVFSVE